MPELVEGSTGTPKVPPRGGVSALRPEEWLVVAAIGLVVFVVGVVRQTTQWIGGPSLYGTPWLAVGVAVVGGSILGLGASRWYDTRPGGPANLRPRNRAPGGSTIRDSPSFEIYRPESLDGRRRRR